MGVQDILRTKLQRISKEQHASREHLLSIKSLDTLIISLFSFKVAVTKPYVFEKLKRYCACGSMSSCFGSEARHISGTLVALNTSAQISIFTRKSVTYAHRHRHVM